MNNIMVVTLKTGMGDLLVPKFSPMSESEYN